MDYSEEDIIVRGHYVRPHIRQRVPQKHESFVTRCEFCEGTGQDPGNHLFDQDCPACRGRGNINLPGGREDYESCGRCGGDGADPNDMWVLRPCHICKGTGLVIP